MKGREAVRQAARKARGLRALQSSSAFVQLERVVQSLRLPRGLYWSPEFGVMVSAQAPLRG